MGEAELRRPALLRLGTDADLVQHRRRQRRGDAQCRRAANELAP